jgi:hypothetical protein
MSRELPVIINKIFRLNQHHRGGEPKTALRFWLLALNFLLFIWLAACQPFPDSPPSSTVAVPTKAGQPEMLEPELPTPSPFPARPNYQPGELVDYVAQTGDTLPGVAVHFNTSVDEILDANPIIPAGATTLPPGMPMKIPVYYKAFWGSPFQIIPNSLFVNGPMQADFNTREFVDNSSGWLNGYVEYAAGANRTGGEIVDYVALNFSVSPQLLLAVLEYQARALTQQILPQTVNELYPLGYVNRRYHGLYLQLVWAANLLNNGYYGWQTGHLTTLLLPDETIEHPDPWQNAATVALQFYFSRLPSKTLYLYAIGPDGLAFTFKQLFGDPWVDLQFHIPGSLQQPLLLLPFESGKTWAYTGGPHTGWGSGEPWAAIDFAPPSDASGCIPSNEWNTAIADGIVARTGEGVLELDLDGDGDTRTGWVIFYLHIAALERAEVGEVVIAGQPIGHPSCEGGTSTGTHIHIARKYNGEWIPADGVIPFNLEGWIAHNGDETYQGTMTRFSKTVVANTNATQSSYITAGILE